MVYKFLCEFIDMLEVEGDFVCIIYFVFIDKEMIEIYKWILYVGGLVLLFENVVNEKGEKSEMFCFVNLFGMVKCVV